MMFSIQLSGSYICMFQLIFHNCGTLAAKVAINQNMTGFDGYKNFNLTCSLFLQKGEQIISVQIIAKSIKEHFNDEKRPIAIFEPGRTAKLHPSAKNIFGRVTLINITNTSTYATMKFHVLKCADEKDYMCKVYYYDMDGAISKATSEATRISVKDQVGDVHINNQPNQRQYDRNTDNITLTCKASGDPEPKYTWFKDNNNDTILSRENVYVIEDVIRNKSGVYICEAYNNINDVTYTHSNSVEIDIIDELLLLPEPASLENSSEHAAYVVPLILVLAVVVIVSIIAVRKHLCNRPTMNPFRTNKQLSEFYMDILILRKNKENRWHNILGCFNKRHGSDENLSYAVVDRKEPGDVSNGMNENEKNKEKGLDEHLLTSSDNIYAVPCDALQAEMLNGRISCEK